MTQRQINELFFFSIFFSFFNVQIALFTLIIFLGEILPVAKRLSKCHSLPFSCKMKTIIVTTVATHSVCSFIRSTQIHFLIISVVK